MIMTLFWCFFWSGAVLFCFAAWMLFVALVKALVNFIRWSFSDQPVPEWVTKSRRGPSRLSEPVHIPYRKLTYNYAKK
jgi:hypothetical protein